VAFYLGRRDPSHTESCPFLAKKQGNYCVDLSLIPEKYRLDVKQAEEVLNRCLNRWLQEAEGTPLYTL
jgi:ATP-dependent Lon protease